MVATDPEPGERVRQGTVVEIEVSNGLSPTAVLPDLVGTLRNQANQTLTQLRNSSNIEFTWVFDEVVTAIEADDRLVIATVPGAGATIDEETEIVVTVWRYEPPGP